MKAAIANDIQRIQELINSQSKEIVLEGIRNAGSREIFMILAAKYGELGVDHKDLARACRYGSKEIVEIILKRLDTTRLTNHTEGESILKRCCIHHAAVGGYHDIVEYLLKNSREKTDLLKVVDRANNTALHFASMRGHTDVIMTILKSGDFGKSQINDLNGKGLTPLHCAAYFGKLSAVQLLVKWGANKCSKDLRGRSVLHWCTMGQEQSSQFSWYDSEFNLLPATYGSQEEYTKIMEMIND